LTHAFTGGAAFFLDRGKSMTEENKVVEDPKVVKEQAQAEFDQFVKKMDLDLETSDMDQEDLTQFEKQKNKVLREIMRGNLIINDNGEPVYTPHRTSALSEPITFYEPDCAVILMMDKKKTGQDVGKMYALMGAMTHQSAAMFSKLKGTDYKVCSAIASLFLD
jgi:hypothetical protein